MMLEIKHYPFPPPGDAPAVEREPYPAPLLTSRDPVPPGTVAQPVVLELARLFDVHGWQHMITFAEGYVPHAAYGTPSKLPKKSQALRLQRGRQQAIAMRLGASWDIFQARDAGRPSRYGTLEAFRDAMLGAVQACDKPPVSTLAPLHGCAVTGMKFVRCATWGAAQGPEQA
jgi:hypothetical protein